MAYDKSTFLKKAVILCDTAEQKNDHIIKVFDEMGVKHKAVSLDFGDYSFTAEGRDFSLSCVIERKANINELYSNLTQDRERIEREFIFAGSVSNDFCLLIENCPSLDALKNYTVPEWEMKRFGRKVDNIGDYCYCAIKSWECGNKYSFNTIFAENKADTAVILIEHFYYYWRNFKKLAANRRRIG